MTIAEDKGQKIVIVGDSHTQDLARNVKYYLNENYRCSGFVTSQLLRKDSAPWSK